MDKSLDWWRGSRVGLFIHWGLYSATEGYWNGVHTKGIGEWIQERERIPLAEYKEYAGKMTLEKFEADKWAEIIKKAGLKYIVLTAKHHEGFAMYDSKWDDYNVVKMGPSHRNPAMELAVAARKQGLKMCFYYSQAHDWADKDAVGNTWDFNEDEKDFANFLNGKCKYQLKELLTDYGDVGLIWFDVPQKISREQSIELKKYVKEIQPECLVSGRISSETGIGDYGSLGDNQLPKGKIEGDWETPITLNHTWGYKRDDNNWKSTGEIINLVTDLLSKGVNCLINIGPKADGEIPEESLKILNELGVWMNINGEAVYGTTCSPFLTDFPWGNVSKKGHNMYLYVKKPSPIIFFSGLRTDVKKVTLFSKTPKKLAFKQYHDNEKDEHVIEIEMPSENNCRYVNVIKLEMDGEIETVDYLCQQPDGSVTLPAYLAEIYKGEESGSDYEDTANDTAAAAESFNLKHKKELSISQAGVIENWKDTSHHIEWEFTVYQPAEFQVELRTFGRKYETWVGGHKVSVECTDHTIGETLKADVIPDSSGRHYFSETGSNIGTLKLNAGCHRLCLYADMINDNDPAGLLVSELILKNASGQEGE